MPNKAKTPSAATLEVQSLIHLPKGIKSMNNSISLVEKSQLTMSSREIAKLTDKQHKHVLRDIENMFTELNIDSVEYAQNWTHPQNKQIYKEYQLPKKYIECLLTGYSIPLRMKVIDRLHELEETVNQNQLKMPTTKELALMVIQVEEEKEKLQLEVKELTPKAMFHDKVTSTHDAISLAQAAKTLGTGRNRLCSFLRQNKWLRRNNEPYQEKIDQGLLDVKLTNWEHPETGLQQSVTALVTGKGLVRIQSLLVSH